MKWDTVASVNFEPKLIDLLLNLGTFFAQVTKCNNLFVKVTRFLFYSSILSPLAFGFDIEILNIVWSYKCCLLTFVYDLL